MPQPTGNGHEWYVSLPLSDLNMLRNELVTLEGMKAENAQLRREMDGLRNMYSELLVQFGELKRELMKR